MKVLKFGGTSVGSVESILSLQKIVEGQDQQVVVVVSALGGITDKLIATSKMAVNGDSRYEDEFNAMVERHHTMIDTIITDTDKRTALTVVIDKLLDELKSIYYGVYLIRDLSPKTMNAIVSYGERLSSNIVATLVKGAKWYDSRDFIKTAMRGGKHILDAELTNSLVEKTFKDMPQVALVPGFISSDKNTG
ncbi:MAG: bifunctional aspartate kinase/homoserine dehydrogenase I, partial [Prevotella sp.]|nr:bifunctional aspartate kinase/homoserine dehydrogenase I [Prevotella sp.]